MKIILCQGWPYIYIYIALVPSASLCVILVYILVYFPRLYSYSTAFRSPQFSVPENVGFLESAPSVDFAHSCQLLQVF